MLLLGEIDISPWNHFPLRELLLVPLIILHGIEEGIIKPRLLVSLRLSKLRRLSRAFATLEATVFLLEAIKKKTKMKETRLVEREAHT